MHLDDAACYRAIVSRDRRFDGRFVIAVATTKIYCRPGCPARTPRRKNVRFYRCAAAAEDAGFRACLRCRPDTSPDTAARSGTVATVSRALRLIAEGALDERGIDDLAGRLGVGERHLRRLFSEHLGASPIAVAQSRRAHFARRLIEDTRLGMTEIASASGFSSVRRFNEEVRRRFGRAPRELRTAAPASAPTGRTAVCRLRLTYKPPYDWDALMAFLSARATPGLEQVTPEVYRRVIALDGAAAVVEIRRDAGADALVLGIDAIDGPVGRGVVGVVERARRVCDLGADPHVIGEHLRADPRLARSVARRSGLRVPGAWDPFELAVRAILGQQVTVRGASTLAGRLVAAFGRSVPGLGRGLSHLFPTADILADADLRAIGLPRARAEAIRHLAAEVSAGRLLLDGRRGLDEATAQLSALPGIGLWTAHYIAMRAFGEPDAFPAGDLVLRRALGEAGELASRREVTARAEAWRPWRAYAAMHLWAGCADEHEATR